MTYTILVVDDRADEREAIGGLLRLHHYAVEFAANGEEALQRLRQGEPPAVIVLDLNMPVMDGWELMVRLAHDDRLGQLPVVVISGAPVVRDAPAVPPNVTFLAKPLQAQVFLEAIARLLTHGWLARAATGRDYAVMAIDDADTERYVTNRSTPAPIPTE
jgi:CheY-like chemotaxis protein